MTNGRSTATTTYPAAPWMLKGHAIQTVQPLDIAQARPLIPDELEIVSVFPGKTLGGIYFSHYGAGSDLEYSELIVVSGVVRYATHVGIWVSHIYVDNPNSVAGGREIWGLPKELARFEWLEGDQPSVSVHRGDRLLCQLQYKWQVPGMRQGLPFSGFSTMGSNLLWFSGDASAYPHLLLGANLQVPGHSPFAPLGLDQPWFIFYARQLQLKIGQPEIVGTKEL